MSRERYRTHYKLNWKLWKINCYRRNMMTRRTNWTLAWNTTHFSRRKPQCLDGANARCASMALHRWSHWWKSGWDDDCDDPLGSQLVFPVPVENMLDYGEYCWQRPVKYIERGFLDALVSERLTRIVYMQGTSHVMTNDIIQNCVFIAQVARFVQWNKQKVVDELKPRLHEQVHGNK